MGVAYNCIPMDIKVKEHRRKSYRVRTHNRHVLTKGEKLKISKGAGDDYLKKLFRSMHPDHSLNKLKIHHNKSGKITATYHYGSGNVAHFTYGGSGWIFNYEN